MPKLAANAFLKKYSPCVCVTCQFSDYAKARAAARKAKRAFLTDRGQNIPTPNQVLTALAKKLAKHNYAIQGVTDSLKTGVVVRVLCSSQDDADAIGKAVGAQGFAPGDKNPCGVFANSWVSGELQSKLAQQLGLI